MAQQAEAKSAKQTNKTDPVFLSASTIATKQPESFPTASHGIVTWKTLISAGLTPTDSLTAGIATCPAESGYLAHHRHEQAEIYVILSGEGVVRIDGEERQVGEGDVVFIPGNAEHGITVVEGGGDVRWFYCFAADRFEDVVYRFSGEGGGVAEGREEVARG